MFEPVSLFLLGAPAKRRLQSTFFFLQLLGKTNHRQGMEYSGS